jgi:hypothetical protein
MSKSKTVKVEDVKGLTYEKLILRNMQVNSLKNVGLTVPSITNLIKLKAELKVTIEEYNAALKALLEDKWKLTPEKTGGYTYLGHKDEAAIKKDLDTLKDTEVVLKSKLNFLSMKELQASTEGLEINLVSELHEFLAVKE